MSVELDSRGTTFHSTMHLLRREWGIKQIPRMVATARRLATGSGVS